MENDKLKVDEKTARIIEEMDKSLRNMEQAMGPDHMVVAKILDSYAKLLRQNNIRHLDAVNMEARAKHIRAKHNQQEEKAQMEGLSNTAPKQKRGMSVAQARVVVWCIAGVVFCAIGYGAFEVIKGSSKNIKNVTHKFRTDKGEQDDGNFVVDGEGKTVEDEGPREPVTDESANTPVTPRNAGQEVQTTPPTTTTTTTTTTTVTNSGDSESGGMTVLEFAKKSLEVKNFAKEKVSEAMELEKNKDFPAAAQTYFSVISMAQQVSAQVGRPIYSESIAKAFEGYGRMAELDNHPEIAQQSEKAAADVRAHLGASED